MTPATLTGSAGLEDSVASGPAPPLATQWSEVTEPIQDWNSYVQNRLQALHDLQEDWDTFKSPPVTASALRSAFVLCFVIGRLRSHLSLPHIAPITGGGIGIQFHEGVRELEVEILPDGTPSTLQVERDVVLAEEDQKVDMELIRRWVDWLESR